MLRGNIFITTDMAMLRQMALANKVVMISEVPNAVLMEFNALGASILLAPYDAMEAQIDGDLNTYASLYYLHLNKKESQHFIAAILRAVMQGVNILIYMSPDEFRLNGTFILEFLRNDYGVYVGTPTNAFYFDIRYTSTVCCLLYLYELMSVEEFFEMYPVGETINPVVLSKLVAELNPYVAEQTIESYSLYFFNFKEKIKKNKNKFLVSPIKRA